MKKIITLLIIISLTVGVVMIMSQHVTFAQPFLPFNIINNNNNNNNITKLPQQQQQQQETVMNQTAAGNSYLLSYIDPTFNFKISYPSNLTKYGVLNLNLYKTTYTGHESIGEVGFGLPKSNRTFLTISFGKESGNFLLKDYVANETNLLSRYVGFKQLESTPISLGGNPAYKIVYVYGIVKNGSEVNRGKVMEIITISRSWPILVEYKGSLNDYQKYLPVAQKIIDSFRFIGE